MPTSHIKCPGREGETSLQREAGIWGTETETLVVALGLWFWKFLWLNVTHFLWLFSLLFDSVYTTLLITREHWSYISGPCNQNLLTHPSLPELLDSNFAFLQPIWMPQQKRPLKLPWVMSLLSPKGLSMVLVLEKVGFYSSKKQKPIQGDLGKGKVLF